MYSKLSSAWAVLQVGFPASWIYHHWGKGVGTHGPAWRTDCWRTAHLSWTLQQLLLHSIATITGISTPHHCHLQRHHHHHHHLMRLPHMSKPWNQKIQHLPMLQTLQTFLMIQMIWKICYTKKLQNHISVIRILSSHTAAIDWGLFWCWKLQ